MRIQRWETQQKEPARLNTQAGKHIYKAASYQHLRELAPLTQATGVQAPWTEALHWTGTLGASASEILRTFSLEQGQGSLLHSRRSTSAPCLAAKEIAWQQAILKSLFAETTAAS